MKRLWKYIPPCLSDVQGFQAVINETDGMGIVDDPSRYKFIPTAERTQKGNYGAASGIYDRGGMRGPEGRRGGMEIFGMEGRGGGFSKEGRGHGGSAGRGGKGGPMAGLRVVCSDLRNEDIISGTEAKLLSAFKENAASLNPRFVLLCNAPSSSMISSDLDMAAYKINQSSDLPAMAVNLHGDKDYLYGISLTLEAMGKLLIKKAENTDPRGVNILGCNTIDWSAQALEDLKRVLKDAEWNVLSCWGAAKTATEQLYAAASARINLVVNVSGMRLAKYMYEEFGIPYVCGAPYGAVQTADILARLKAVLENGMNADETRQEQASEGEKTLIIGEQFMCNAIRTALAGKGFGQIIVASLYEMDKAYMAAGDKKLNSEDDLAAMAQDASLIIADPDCKGAVSGAACGSVKWICLPNSGMAMIEPVPHINMVNEKLDEWLAATARNTVH